MPCSMGRKLALGGPWSGSQSGSPPFCEAACANASARRIAPGPGLPGEVLQPCDEGGLASQRSAERREFSELAEPLFGGLEVNGLALIHPRVRLTLFRGARPSS